MSAPVGVRKAMRVAEAYCYDAGASSAAKNLRAASDAVAELIEAAETILDPHTPVSVNGQYAALRAALARVHGVQS